MRQSRQCHEDDDPDDDAAEPIDEGPDERDLDPEESEEDTPTEDCPQCGREIHADSEWCPYCGEPSRRESRSLPTWVLAGVLLALLAAGVWVLR